MEIKEKVVKYKYHIALTIIFTIMLVTLVVIAPSFLTILAYFWPLFLSTALFLVAVVFFGKTTPSVAVESAVGVGGVGVGVGGESLLDYVAGQTHQLEAESESFFNSEQ